MSALTQTIRDLQAQRNRAQQQLEKLNLAIKALERLDGSVAVEREARPKRKLSLVARKKIAAAQRARWAKVRAKKK